MAKRHKELLTALEVARAKPKAHAYRLADGGGLYLWVPSSGVKTWQFRYRHGGKQQTATFGRVSDAQGLAWARSEAVKARARVEQGDHLTRVKAVRKAHKAASANNTFASIAADWVADEARRSDWTPGHVEQVSASIENHLSKLAPLPIAEITADMAVPLVRRLERSTPDMAKKVRQRLRAIFDFAVEGGVIKYNPVPAPRRRKKAEGRSRLPAVIEKDAVGAILRAADGATASIGVRRAHLLAVFTAQRASEVVGATWSEFDLKAGVWLIPRGRMKRKDTERGPHKVPLPPALRAQMIEWRRADGDCATYVCPGAKDATTITREAVEKFYRVALKLANKHSPHSWRTVFSTWANDAGRDAAVVEAQLDHNTGTQVQTAYDRAERLELRRELMKWHEQALVAARDGAKVLPIHPARGAKH